MVYEAEGTAVISFKMTPIQSCFPACRLKNLC